MSTAIKKFILSSVVFAASFGLFASKAFAQASNCQGLFQQKQLQEAPMKTLRVAAIQFPFIEGLATNDFLKQVDDFLLQAVQQKAQLVVFPELITAELVNLKSKVSEKDQLTLVADEFTPAYHAWLLKRARELNISILGGTSPRRDGNRIKNTAALAFPDGRLVLQDKMFLTPDEKDWGWSPGTELDVFEAPWGSTVILTCFDCEFPLVSQSLAKEKPDMILVPSWTGSQSGLNRVDWTARARAVEHFAYVVKTGTVPSPNSTQAHFGRGTIIGPQDQGFSTDVIEGKLNEPQVLIGDLDLELQRTKKPSSGYYPGHEQQIRKDKFNVVKTQRSRP